MTISGEEELRKLYGWPKGRAGIKILNALEKHSLNFIQNSPFLIISTYGKNGQADASPRGGHPGFVKPISDSVILIPDAKGNNRVDSLVNIVETGKIGCLFFIPGINETLRLNGNATVSTDPDYLRHFTEDKTPISCIYIDIEEVFLHCAKALMRSDLWGESYRLSRPGFPSMGTMLNDQLGTNQPVESEEDMIKRYKKEL